MILEEVWVFIEIYGFKREFAETFTTIGVCRGLRGYTTATKLGTRAILDSKR